MRRSRGKKRTDGGLGKAVVRATAHRKSQKAPETHEFLNWHPPDAEQGKKEELAKLQSVTQQTDLAELAMQADLAETNFAAEKQNVVILSSNAFKAVLEPSQEQLAQQYKHFNDLTIPRRPKWDSNTTATELDQNEKKSFLEWRRKLAELEQNEKLVLTPFEKNIEVWRQLWRVVERSDIVVQIVDGRNPMIRCTDLEKYVKEVDPKKQNLLLVNKADLLTKNQRMCWARYFFRNGVKFLFWSANFEKIKQDEREARAEEVRKEMDQEEREGGDNSSEDEAAGDGDEEQREGEKEDATEPNRSATEDKAAGDEVAPTIGGDKGADKEKESKNEPQNETTTTASEKEEAKLDEAVVEAARIRSTDEFLGEIRKMCEEAGVQIGETKKVITVGMVGYPNVGKSSTINVLCGEKKVSVSLTPGKTKHLQTIQLMSDIILCDCPGLVFPSFLTTKPEMLCSGLLPIDHMRDHRGPVALVCRRIPRPIFEWMYGIALPLPGDGEDPNRDPTPDELLQAYGRIRGFMTSHGVPNESRAARLILKDYLTGKLLFAHPPPEPDSQWRQWHEDEEAEHFGMTARDIKNEEELMVQRQKRVKASPVGLDEISWAAQANVRAHTSGHKGKAKGQVPNEFRRVQFAHSPVPRGRGGARGAAPRGRGGRN